jgi:hypothetical protein
MLIAKPVSAFAEHALTPNAVFENQKPGCHSRAFSCLANFLRICRIYRAARNFESVVPIKLKTLAVWLAYS